MSNQYNDVILKFFEYCKEAVNFLVKNG